MTLQDFLIQSIKPFYMFSQFVKETEFLIFQQLWINWICIEKTEGVVRYSNTSQYFLNCVHFFSISGWPHVVGGWGLRVNDMINQKSNRRIAEWRNTEVWHYVTNFPALFPVKITGHIKESADSKYHANILYKFSLGLFSQTANS